MVIAENKKARFDVNIEQTLEAGLVLTADEIKSIRANRVQITGGFIKPFKGVLAVHGIHLSIANDPDRIRNILLKNKEIQLVLDATTKKGKAVVPLNLHLKRGWAKLEIGIGTGRKNYDKRELIKSRDLEREARGQLKLGPR